MNKEILVDEQVEVDRSYVGKTDIQNMINEVKQEIEEINQQCINGDEFDILVERVKKFEEENAKLKEENKRQKTINDANTKAIHEQFSVCRELLRRIEDLEKYAPSAEY